VRRTKGLVERAVTSVITPGIALDDEYLQAGTNNYIAAISVNGKCSGLSYMDVLTGDFRVIEFKNLSSLEDELRRVAPKELVVEEGTSFSDPGKNKAESFSFKKVSTLSSYDFSKEVATERLIKKFNVQSMDGFGCAEFSEGLRAAGALLHYVKEARKTEFSHITKLAPYYLGNYLALDHTSRRNLEITENIRTHDKRDTLLGLLDRTKTAMGARLMRRWLSYPLTELSLIQKRQDAVEILIEEKITRSDIDEALDGVYDLERLIGRVSFGVINPRELVSLKLSLKRVPILKELLNGLAPEFLTELRASLDEVEEATSLIENAVNDTPPATLKDGGVIKAGFRAELDELREIGTGGKDAISALEARERERTGVSTLKVGYNRVFGYYINIPKTKSFTVPDDYIRKQTLVNAERYITPELKDFETRVLSAQEKILLLEGELYCEIRDAIAKFTDRVKNTALAVSSLDALNALAEVAEKQNYTKPLMEKGSSIVIIEGRHPVIEATLKEDFVPNDITIDSSEQIHIITGPNMAGKSTFMRQVALTVLMAQVGSFVPAKSARIGVVDRIFTRVGASDDLARGQSTFMVEMNETANILNNATDSSLIILDEIGRGTSTFDGLSIAWAVAEFLHDKKGKKAKTLFATHYHELTELSLTKERVKNYNISVKEYDGKVIFLRKVVPGGASRSYGIQVAKLAGLPDEVVKRAELILQNLESGELNDAGKPRFISNNKEGEAKEAQPNLPNLFAHDAALREHIRSIDLDKTTPIDALKALYKLKEIVDS
jgi:DNA mismatch repair protein MutS